MRATAFVLSLASRRSLVILDELGRGTSPGEGAAISQAVSEELVARKSTTLFATHFLELTKALEDNFGVRFHHFAVSHRTALGRPEEPFEMVFSHKLELGKCGE